MLRLACPVSFNPVAPVAGADTHSGGALPAHRADLKDMPSQLQIRGLLDNALDFGLVRLPLNVSGVHTRMLFESLVVALAQDHPLLAKRRIQPQDLLGCPLLVLGRKFAPGLYDQMLVGFHRRKITLTIAREMGEFPTLLALVAAGLGIGILPDGAASALPAGVVIRPLTLAMSGAGIGVAWTGLENPRKRAGTGARRALSRVGPGVRLEPRHARSSPAVIARLFFFA